MRIIEEISDNHVRAAELRRDLHAHPELAYQETRTADLVTATLEAVGIEVHRGLGRTGVVGTIRAGSSGRAIALRADMDALPIHELNTFAHRSNHDGKMHACGHDGHTAMLLAAAQYLARHQDFDGCVHLVFQPAEEGFGGAKAMIEDGLFDRFPVDAVFGMHNWPGLPAGQFALRSGTMMAAVDEFEIEISGTGSHAAMPHEGVDPVLVAAHVITALQSLSSRRANAHDPVVVSVTQVNGGQAFNVIPEKVTLRGTARTLTPSSRDRVEQEMAHLVTQVAAGFGAKGDTRYRRGYPPTINSPAESELASRAAAAVVGQRNVRRDLPPSMGGEDFAFMLQAKPGCYLWIGNGEGTGGCVLHNPNYDFNDDILPIGASYWVRLVEQILPLQPQEATDT